jgi:hypothetical protein
MPCFQAVQLKSSDVTAMSAMRALTERGRKIPADVAVGGFDAIPLATYTTPPLTTVRQDCLAGARTLVDKVLRTRAGEAVESEVIPVELIVRASSLRQHHHDGSIASCGNKPPQPGAQARVASGGVEPCVCWRPLPRGGASQTLERAMIGGAEFNVSTANPAAAR